MGANMRGCNKAPQGGIAVHRAVPAADLPAVWVASVQQAVAEAISMHLLSPKVACRAGALIDEFIHTGM